MYLQKIAPFQAFRSPNCKDLSMFYSNTSLVIKQYEIEILIDAHY